MLRKHWHRVLAGAALALWPSIAFADPISAAVAAITVAATTAATKGLAALATAAVLKKIAAAAVVGGLLGILFRPDQPQIGTLRTGSRSASSTASSRAYVYGRARVNGQLVYANTVQTRRRRQFGRGGGLRWVNGPVGLATAYALSEGAIEGLDAVYLHGERVELEQDREDSRHWTGTGRWRGRIQLYTYFRADGTEGQELRLDTGDNRSRFAHLLQRGSGLRDPLDTSRKGAWTTDHKMNGISWAYVLFVQNDYDRTNAESRFYQQSPLHGMEFQVRGRRITFPGQTTPVFTANAAAVRYDWETEIRGWAKDKVGADGDFQAAFQICNQYVDYGPLPEQYRDYDSVERRYEINGVYYADDSTDATQRQFDHQWQGNAIVFGDKLLFRPGVSRPPKLTLTKDNVVSIDGTDLLPEIVFGPPLQERLNEVQTSLAQSKLHEYKEHILNRVRDADAFARDGGLYKQDIPRLAYEDSPLRAYRLLINLLRRARYPQQVRIKVGALENFETFSLIPSDVVILDLPDEGVNTLRMVVDAVSYSYNDASVELTLRREPTNAYEDTLQLEPITTEVAPEPDTEVASVADLQVSQETRRQQDGTVVIHATISWTPEEFSTRLAITRGTERTLYNVEGGVLGLDVVAGETLEIVARHRRADNSLGEPTRLSHIVQGDLTPPERPTNVRATPIEGGIRLDWTPSTSSDVSHYDIAVRRDTRAPTEASFQAPNTDTIERQAYADGEVRYYSIRAVDRSGNASTWTDPRGATVNEREVVRIEGPNRNIPKRFYVSVDSPEWSDSEAREHVPTPINGDEMQQWWRRNNRDGSTSFWLESRTWNGFNWIFEYTQSFGPN